MCLCALEVPNYGTLDPALTRIEKPFAPAASCAGAKATGQDQPDRVPDRG